MFWIYAVTPPVDGEYLVTIEGATRPTILTYENKKWIDDYGTEFVVEAWLPLPPVYRFPMQTMKTCYGTNNL